MSVFQRNGREAVGGMLSVPRRQVLKRLCGGIVTLAATSLASDDHTPASHSPRTGYFHDPRTLDYAPPAGHPEIAERVRAIDVFFRRGGLIKRLAPIAPHRTPLPHIRALHSPAHVESIQKLGAPAEAAQLAVAGALGACDAVCTGAVRNAFCAVRPPGHHSFNQGRQHGYCYFNTVAIAAQYCRRAHNLNKILIIDWDYHHGNGTEAHFRDNPSVLFFSTHNRLDFPGTGRRRRRGTAAATTINVHLGRGTTDSDMLAAWRTHLLPAAHHFRPDIVLVSAGFDSRTGDPLGTHHITDNGFRLMTRMAVDLATRFAHGRLVSVLEGGYDPRGTALAAAAHVGALLEQTPSESAGS